MILALKNIRISPLFQKLGWTVGSYGVMQVIRFANNIILARLLAPSLFGIMSLLTTVRVGIEMFSDIGIGQSVITNKDGDEPRFYNTAWTIQIIRGLFLAAICLISAELIARFYKNAELGPLISFISLYFIASGFSSPSTFLMQRHMKLKLKAVFDVIVAIIGAIIHIGIVWFFPTIWGLVWAGLISLIIVVVLSHFFLPGLRIGLVLDRNFAKEIIHFGKWIFLATILYFIATNFDRLYLASAITMTMLGIYGVSRSLTEMVSALAVRIGGYVIVPLVSAWQGTRDELNSSLQNRGSKMLLGAAVAFAVMMASSDILIRLLYDQRYWLAGAIMPVQCLIVWFSTLSSISDSVLIGIRKPRYSATANLCKLVVLAISLPLCMPKYGIWGALIGFLLADVARYIYISFARHREGFHLLRWEGISFAVMLVLAVVLRALFHQFGLIPLIPEGLPL